MIELKQNSEDISSYSNFQEIIQKSVYLVASIDL